MNNKLNFNQVRKGKDEESRNDINNRLQDFMTPNYINTTGGTSLNFNNNETDFKINNSNNNNNSNKFRNIDRNDFKNDINNRMNSFSAQENFNLRRLPLNNNIRDYGITTDSKKDEFNERLSNYNLLSSNMVPSAEQKTNSYTMGFHTSFKDDVNQRMHELSPLSRNVGLPVHYNVPNTNKKPDFSKNLDEQEPSIIETYKSFENMNINNTNNNYNNQEISKDINNKYVNQYQSDILKDNNETNIKSHSLYNDTYQSFSTSNNYSLLNGSGDGINQLGDMKVNDMYPMNTRQTYNFNN
tara:strand:- start:1734 stop:2627 length:894 start_codon:yes stop_codon:yes gene_type:complete